MSCDRLAHSCRFSERAQVGSTSQKKKTPKDGSEAKKTNTPDTPTAIRINASQESGAIFLPLRLRSNGMPILIVNTHLACNTC